MEFLKNINVINEVFMRRAIQLAYNGFFLMDHFYPLVGYVIEKKGKVILEDWYCNKNHNEMFFSLKKRINNEIEKKKILLSSTLYITMEPILSYQSCIDLIIKHQIHTVVIGMKNYLLKEKGLWIKSLRKNGILVLENCLKKQCFFLNRRFFLFRKKLRPYIILKWNQSLDGFIINNNHYYNKIFHKKWKYEEHGCLLEYKVLMNYYNKENLKIDSDKIKYRIFTIAKYYYKNKKQLKNIYPKIGNFFLFSHETNNIKNILRFLYRNKVQSLLVEVGLKMLKIFLKKNIWNECRILLHKVFIGNGLRIPDIQKKIFHKTVFNNKKHQLIYIYNK
ncbi:dihydrofolate reductase family protein [Blattabacterium cuenoti]|uniref:dihydrofolate reductase family protein n=1 Tax=Blattabacterium cuenoti TaxID=1653831 RepID=UPI00163D2A0D|nr:dihydrofolate reductase family protein [Blattabacterium cuenoti]